MRHASHHLLQDLEADTARDGLLAICERAECRHQSHGAHAAQAAELLDDERTGAFACGGDRGGTARGSTAHHEHIDRVAGRQLCPGQPDGFDRASIQECAHPCSSSTGKGASARRPDRLYGPARRRAAPPVR